MMERHMRKLHEKSHLALRWWLGECDSIVYERHDAIIDLVGVSRYLFYG
jgi:hypothetical protein